MGGFTSSRKSTLASSATRTDDVPEPVFSADSGTFAWSMSDVWERRNRTMVQMYWRTFYGTQESPRYYHNLRRWDACKEGDERGYNCLRLSRARRLQVSSQRFQARCCADFKLGPVLWNVPGSFECRIAFGPSGVIGAIAREDGTVRLFFLTTSASYMLCRVEHKPRKTSNISSF